MDGLKEPPPYNTRRALKDREKTAAVDAILLDSIASQALERDVAMAEASTQNHEESSTQRITLVEPPSIYPDLSGINNGGQTPPSLQDGEPAIGISPEPQEGEPATHPSPVSQSKPCGPQAKDDSPLSPDSQETTSSHSPSPTPRSENEEESDSPPPTTTTTRARRRPTASSTPSQLKTASPSSPLPKTRPPVRRTRPITCQPVT